MEEILYYTIFHQMKMLFRHRLVRKISSCRRQFKLYPVLHTIKVSDQVETLMD